MRRFATSLPLPLLALAATVLTACGGSSSGQESNASSPSSASPSGPSCSAVWSGDTLPQRYQGCVADSGFVRAARQSCSSGQVIVTFDNRYYAVPGGPINDVGSLEGSAQYRQAVRRCRA